MDHTQDHAGQMEVRVEGPGAVPGEALKALWALNASSLLEAICCFFGNPLLLGLPVATVFRGCTS